MKYNYMFQPIQIGQMTVKNRFTMCAVSTDFAEKDSAIGQRIIDYYAARAKGGFGMIVVEASAVNPEGKALDREIGVWDDSFIPGLAKLAAGIHEGGAKAILQLHHCGRQTTSAISGCERVVAPAAVPCPVRQQMPHMLTTAEVEELVEEFADAAYRAYQAGFDGVELNGAHGYIITQFMSLYVNKRTDKYGGNLNGRMRFPLEIIRGIRRRCGVGFEVIFRMSADEDVTAGRSTLESVAVARILEEAGVSALSISGGVYASIHNMTAPGRIPPGHNVNAAGEVKKAVHIPVLVAGRINSPALAESIIASGKADIIAFGRGAVTDPEMPKKAYAGQEEEILPCVACLQGCIGYLLEEHRPISCLVNPFVGEEGTMKIEPAPVKKKITIVGGGPAGLYAAWVLAKRGHRVSLYEKSDNLGGQLRLGAVPAGKAELMCGLRHFVLMGEKYGVTYHLGTEYTEDAAKADQPDVLILATGGQPLRPPIRGLDLPIVIEANKILAGEAFPHGNVLVLGGGMVGCEVAEYIADYGMPVTIMEMRDDVAVDAPGMSRAMLLKSLKEKNVRILTGARCMDVHEGGSSYQTKVVENGGTGYRTQKVENIDTVVLALGCRSYNPLEEKVKGLAKEVYVLGDAVKAGKAIDHIYQAAKLAVKI